MKVAMLGGGQLALMLAEAGRDLGLNVTCVAGSPDDPAYRACPGSLLLAPGEGTEKLKKFLSSQDAIIFENEFLDETVLAVVEGFKTRVFPRPAVIRRLRDKLTQKETLAALKIPSSGFLAFGGGDLSAWIADCSRQLGGDCVYKWALGGYDGHGVWLKGVEGAEEFCSRAIKKGARVFAEVRVAFRRELAIVGARSIDGSFNSYPVVVSEQSSGICKRITGPAARLGLRPVDEQNIREWAQLLAETMDLVGVFAMELFETNEGLLLVNEIAPRVHNSGHVTQDSSHTSQFENHLRAVLGRPLGAVSGAPSFAMLNLLGPAGRTGALEGPDCAVGRVHWYAKSETRPGRKMGHLNAVSQDGSESPVNSSQNSKLAKARGSRACDILNL